MADPKTTQRPAVFQMGMHDVSDVVLVDDDDHYREALSADLADRGVAVSCFADGPSFLEAMSNGTEAQVVLLDWVLPEMSGFELLDALRERGQRVRSVDTTPETERHGDLTLHPVTARALWRQQDLELTVTEYKIVARLMAHIGEPQTYAPSTTRLIMKASSPAAASGGTPQMFARS